MCLKKNSYNFQDQILIIIPISPELSVSNVLNTWEQNLSALPVG